MTATDAGVGRVLEDGTFCHIAALTPFGPHVTPMVFAFAGDRVWVTTSRGSVKARAWRGDPRVAGLVRSGDEAVAFAGTVRMHDALDPTSWRRSLRAGPTLALASARFTRKNARFFAGYAVDARRVPLAWTPPGRVFVELSVERAATIASHVVVRTGGAWGQSVPSLERFRAARSGPHPFGALPDEIADAVGDAGAGALGVVGRRGPAVLPARWIVRGSTAYAVMGEDALALAEPVTATPPVALEVERASSWRARDMVGAMVRGSGEIALTRSLAAGARSAAAIGSAAGARGDRLAVVRVRPERFVWWQGWESGTVAAT